MPDQSKGGQYPAVCANCQTMNEPTTWRIIDAQSAPELLEAAIAGTLNTYVCTNCHSSQEVGGPILLYDAVDGRPIIVSPAGVTMGDDESHYAGRLMGLLAASLGESDDWVTRMVKQGIPTIPRARLAAVLRPPARATPDDSMIELLARLVSARTWDTVAQLMADHPELQTPEAEAQLRTGSARLRGDGRFADSEPWERRADFVRALRQSGLSQAIRDVTGLTLDEVESEGTRVSPETWRMLDDMRAQGLDPAHESDRTEFLRRRLGIDPSPS